ncbi:hypothetical protein [Streptacidiphilus sp. PAMC 29251]
MTIQAQQQGTRAVLALEGELDLDGADALTDTRNVSAKAEQAHAAGYFSSVDGLGGGDGASFQHQVLHIAVRDPHSTT